MCCLVSLDAPVFVTSLLTLSIYNKKWALGSYWFLCMFSLSRNTTVGFLSWFSFSALWVPSNTGHVVLFVFRTCTFLLFIRTGFSSAPRHACISTCQWIKLRPAARSSRCFVLTTWDNNILVYTWICVLFLVFASYYLVSHRGSSGLLGPKWLDPSGFPLSKDGLHCPVGINGSPPAAPKARQL